MSKQHPAKSQEYWITHDWLEFCIQLAHQKGVNLLINYL